jgi:hypothetical protein
MKQKRLLKCPPGVVISVNVVFLVWFLAGLNARWDSPDGYAINKLFPAHR